MQRFCVIGSPISHSRSPALHNAAFKALGIDAEYEAVEVKPGELRDFMEGFPHVYSGMNVTIPHKETVMHYLDSIDDRAQAIGAVNTVVVEGGRLVGYNTDWIGFEQALLEGTGETTTAFLQHKPVLVVGAGGAARAICFAIANMGAQLYITNRTHQKAVELAKAFGGTALRADELSKIQPLLVVNVTSLGMAPHEKESALSKDLWTALRAPAVTQWAFDVVYTPLNTIFLKDARASGYKSITGETMLVHQGAAAFEIFTGKSAPVAVMKEALAH